MGFWFTVGKVALKAGVPALAKVARERLVKKEAKAKVEAYLVEDAQYQATVAQARKRDARERAKAAR